MFRETVRGVETGRAAQSRLAVVGRDRGCARWARVLLSRAAKIDNTKGQPAIPVGSPQHGTWQGRGAAAILRGAARASRASLVPGRLTRLLVRS